MTEIIEVELDPQIIAEQKEWEAGAYDREYAEVERQRLEAYRKESDPLFFKWQAGLATEEEWKASREAVNVKHPYPTISGDV